MVGALRAQTCAQHYTFSIGGQTGERIGAQIGTNTQWNNGQRLWGSAMAGWQERIDARAAPHIHHMRRIGSVDRGPNWYKHSFGQFEEVMGVGDRECALMRAQSVQTCAHNHTYIGGQTAVPIGAHIDTNTY
jgi:hypothetical protein